MTTPNRMIFDLMAKELLEFCQREGLPIIVGERDRSPERQKKLFNEGLSRCDGFKILSDHQQGMAQDVWVREGRIISNNSKYYIKMHEFWVSVGGDPITRWKDKKGKWIIDYGHFSAGRSAMFGFLLKMFSVTSLLEQLSKFESIPEGRIAKALIKANNPEKVAAAEMLIKFLEGSNENTEKA